MCQLLFQAVNMYQQQTRQKSQPQRAQRVRHLSVNCLCQMFCSKTSVGRAGGGRASAAEFLSMRACWTRVNCSNYFWLFILLEGVLGFWRMYLNCGCFFFPNMWLWAVCQRMSTFLKGRINPKLETKFWPGTQLVMLRVCILDWGQGTVRVGWTLRVEFLLSRATGSLVLFHAVWWECHGKQEQALGFFFPLRQPLLHSHTNLTLTFFEALID